MASLASSAYGCEAMRGRTGARCGPGSLQPPPIGTPHTVNGIRTIRKEGREGIDAIEQRKDGTDVCQRLGQVGRRRHGSMHRRTAGRLPAGRARRTRIGSAQAVDRRRGGRGVQCASPWQAARRRPRVTRQRRGCAQRRKRRACHRVHLVDGRGLRHVPCRPAGVHGGTRRFRPARTCSRRRPRARPAMWTRRRCLACTRAPRQTPPSPRS